MRKYAVIVAGGVGSRSGDELPKQFHMLCGRPMLWWSLKAFRDSGVSDIMVVMHPDYISYWKELHSSMPQPERVPHSVCAGGGSRAESVRFGLAALTPEEGSLVAVHDAARPLVTPGMIARGWDAAEASGGAVPVVPVSDSLRHLEQGGSVAVRRSEYVAVQTPQVFRAGILTEANLQPLSPDFTDDASVVESAGFKVAVFEGEVENMKVTNPSDFMIAELLLTRRGDNRQRD